MSGEPIARSPRSKVGIWVAALAALTVFVGFAKTFYLRFLFEPPPTPLLPYIHGTVMTVWVTLFVTQVALISNRRVDLHRRLGKWGIYLAGVVAILGLATAIEAAKRGATPGPSPLQFLAIPFFDVVVFVALTGTGLLLRRHKEAHRRLMLLGLVAIMPAAVARIPLDVVATGGPLIYFGAADLAALVVAAIDTVRRRRLHPAYGWGLAVLIASHPLRLMIMGTPAWDAFARWITNAA